MQRTVKNESSFFTVSFYGESWKSLRLYHCVGVFRGRRSLESQILMILRVAMYHHFGYFLGPSRPETSDSDDTTRRKVSSPGTFRGRRALKPQILMILRVARYHRLGYFLGPSSPQPLDFDDTTCRIVSSF